VPACSNATVRNIEAIPTRSRIKRAELGKIHQRNASPHAINQQPAPALPLPVRAGIFGQTVIHAKYPLHHEPTIRNFVRRAQPELLGRPSHQLRIPSLPAAFRSRLQCAESTVPISTSRTRSQETLPPPPRRGKTSSCSTSQSPISFASREAKHAAATKQDLPITLPEKMYRIGNSRRLPKTATVPKSAASSAKSALAVE
jgi:hypothetical protein